MLDRALQTIAQDGSVPPAVVGGASALAGLGVGAWLIRHLMGVFIPEILRRHADERTQLSEQNRQDRATFIAAIESQAMLHRQERAEFRGEIVAALKANTDATKDLAGAIRERAAS